MHSRRTDPAAVFRELVETASELTGIYGEEAVLSSIVQRTRRLLSADMAYISFNDPATGMTFIRKSDGVLTSAFRSLRVPLNAGILGQVASGEAAFQTRDYFRDPSVPRKGDIDEVVRAEGVTSIMGVPLIDSGRVLGALMVAERAARTYSPQDVGLVESFGRYSVVALANARHISGLKDRADAVERRNNELSVRTAHLQHLHELSEDLRRQMAVDPGIQHLLDLLSDHLGLPVSLRGDADELTWTSRAPRRSEQETVRPSGTATAAETEMAILADRDTMALPLADAATGQDRGRLVAHGRCTAYQVELMEVGATYLSIALGMVRAEEDSRLRQQQDVLADLLEDTPVPPERLARRLRPWGLTLTQRVWLAVVRNPGGTVPEALLRSLPHTVLSGVAQHEYCLVTDDHRWVTAAGDLAQEHRLQIAVSGPVTLGNGIVTGYRRARSCLVLMGLAGTVGLRDSEEIDIVYSLAALAQDSGIMEELLAPLTPLLTHDRSRGGQMTHFAVTYFECDRRIDLTAETLHLHRNTVRQRLATITRLLGPGWDRMPRALDLQVCLRAWVSHGTPTREEARGDRLDRDGL